MKPINVIASGVAVLLVLAGIGVIGGWATRNEFLVFVGTVSFLIACVASCIPLVAVGATATWKKVTHWFHCPLERRDDPARKSTDQSPLG
jgi:hypothetical protein